MNTDQLLDLFPELLEKPPDLGIILGSGQGAAAKLLGATRQIPYAQIPEMPQCRVAGHQGQLGIARWADKTILVFQGRFHLYEGYSWPEVVYLVELLHRLACPRIMLTTSSGGVAQDLGPGDALLIADHINLMGANPVFEIAEFDGGANSFLDLSRIYRLPDQKSLASMRHKTGLRIKTGVLAANLGPIYETPAEVRMLRNLGVDAVCMSTVPEAIWARYRKLETMGLSLVTNAACQADQPVDHQGVLVGAARFIEPFSQLIRLLAEDFLQSVD